MSRRHAAALPAVLMTMALTSAMVVGGVYASRTLATRARLAKSATGLHSPAERVLVNLVASWDTAARAAMPVGTTASSSSTESDGVPVTTSVMRLSAEIYWIVAESVGPRPERMRSRVGLLVRSTDGLIQPVSGPAWTRLP